MFICDVLASQKIKPLIAQRFPLAEARQAHDLLGKGGVIGKIVLVRDSGRMPLLVLGDPRRTSFHFLRRLNSFVLLGIFRVEGNMTKRLESAQTGRTAVHAVKQVLNELNWVANELFEDFGIDLHVKVFESTGERKALPWEFHIQVKGTTSLRRSKGFVLYAVDTEHLCDWHASSLPVLFVVYDVKSRVGYWILVKDYLESLIEDWHVRRSKVLRIPSADVVTSNGLLEAYRRIRRATVIHDAARAIEFMRQPSEDMMGNQQRFLKGDLEPLPPPSASIQDPALAICVACNNIFWIDESWAAGHDVLESDGEDMPQNLDFTKAYYPAEHEAAVYMCDTPENFCPFCMDGRGALRKCAGCGRYRVLAVPLLDTTGQSEELCWECLEGTN